MHTFIILRTLVTINFVTFSYNYSYEINALHFYNGEFDPGSE